MSSRPTVAASTASQVCLGGAVDSVADVERWESIGVTRLLVSPWRRSPEAVDGLTAFAARFGLS